MPTHVSTNSLLELPDTTETLAPLSLELSSPSWTASTSSVCALRLGTEVGLHRGGDGGHRWSLSEEQAHLLGGIRRREPSKAAVDDGLQGDGQVQRGGSDRLLGQPLKKQGDSV